MQVRHLKYFLEVLEHQNLRKASTKLNITQPALTKAIQRLEEELGVQLFVRSRRGMVGTEFAESFRGFARASVIGHQHSLQELKASRAGTAGIVTIAAPPLLVASMLPAALVAFHEANPGVRVVVRITIEELFDLLADGRCDLVFAMQPKPEKRFEGFAEEIFTDDSMLVIARPGHPVANIKKPQIAQLTKYSWALPISRTILRDRLEGIFEEAGAAPPLCAIECLAPELIKKVVQGTELLGWVPQSSCAAEVAAGTLVAIRFSSRLVSRKIGIFWNSYRFTPAAERLKKAILALNG
jgi:DNA-binding transcriptional LysR family regulator